MECTVASRSCESKPSSNILVAVARRSCIAMLILFVAAVPGVFTSRVAADYNEDSRIDDLIARGKYVTASHAIEQAIGRARSVDDKESIPRLLAYLARFSIECGDLQKAEQAI